MTTTEEWRDSPSLPEYQVSSLGRVMRKPYLAEMPKGGTRQYGGQPHYGVDSGEGRMTFVFRGKTYKVHRLICEAFNGPPPEGTVCMHLDSDYKNNLPANLAWGTQKENLNHPVFLEYCRNRLGENNPFIKGRKNAF